MVAVNAEEIKEMRARNAEYVRHRMRIPIFCVKRNTSGTLTLKQD